MHILARAPTAQTVYLTVSANTSNYNVRTAAGSPATATNVVCTVASGVVVAVMDTGSGWAVGSYVTIINRGMIEGPGGNAGQAGSDALRLHCATAVDNSLGMIRGGGGGGSNGSNWGFYGYGGGGGGQGNPGGAGGAGGANVYPGSNGGAGDRTQNGVGGNSGDGGTYGQNGGNGGTWGSAGQPSGVDNNGGQTTNQGAGGKAIALNGYALTWIAGNTPSRVFGAVA